MAVLFPIDWPEPFGMVMIEAMACATPVIAMRCGSVAEIIRDGVSGYVVDSEAEFLAAINRVGECARTGVRREFETRFTSDRMARDYIRLYESLTHPKGMTAGMTWPGAMPRAAEHAWQATRRKMPLPVEATVRGR